MTEDQLTIVDDITDDRARRAATADLQLARADGGAAGVGVVAGQYGGASANLR
ncbi:hypothetical protein D3C81_2150460 [compost metagenome]